MAVLQLLRVARILLIPAIGLGLEVFELLDFGHGFRDHHCVLLVQEEKLLLKVSVYRFDFLHKRVEQYMLLKTTLKVLN